MSSIADKFKKFMPQGGSPVAVGGDSAATLSLDSIETVQTAEDRVEHVRRDAAPEPEPVLEDTVVQSEEAPPPVDSTGAERPPAARARRCLLYTSDAADE